jgi:hypothetical protein
MADHSQAPVTDTIVLQDELADLGVLAPSRSSGEEQPHIAVCPSQRAAMVYALHAPERDAMRASVVTRALSIEGVDQVMWLARDAHDSPREGIVASAEHGELRFRPSGAGGGTLTQGETLRDARGAVWSVEGSLAAVGGSAREGRLLTPEYPDVLARVWAALTCPSSGEVLLSAAPGYEFVDWGRQAHVGGGSHGSLHASDSLGALIAYGVELPAQEPAQWAIRDIAQIVLAHFGLDAADRAAPGAAA